MSEKPITACAARVLISAAIAKAVEDVDAAQAGLDRAIMEGRGEEPYRAALVDARKQGLLLVAELDKHCKEHGCWPEKD